MFFPSIFIVWIFEVKWTGKNFEIDFKWTVKILEKDFNLILAFRLFLASKGFWAEMLGVGDFYYELGVQIVEVCMATGHLNGGRF